MIAVQQVIALYGPAADSCNIDLAKGALTGIVDSDLFLDRIWVEDLVYDNAGVGVWTGQDSLRTALQADYHQDMVARGSAHAGTMPYVVIDGDRASATHYSILIRHVEGEFHTVRVSASRWILHRTESGRWKVESRTNRPLNGDPESLELLSQADDRPDPHPASKIAS